MQSQVLPTLFFLKYCTFTVLPALFALRLTNTCSNSNALNHGFCTFSRFSPYIWNNLPQNIRDSCYFLFLQKQTHYISEYFSSTKLSFTPISLYNMHVCILHLVTFKIKPLWMCTSCVSCLLNCR